MGDKEIIQNRLSNNISKFRSDRNRLIEVKSEITNKTHDRNLYVKDLGIMRGVCVNMEHASQYMQTGTDYLEEAYKGKGRIDKIKGEMSNHKKNIEKYEKSAKKIRDAEKKEVEKLEIELEDLKDEKKIKEENLKVLQSNIINDSNALNQDVPSDIADYK